MSTSTAQYQISFDRKYWNSVILGHALKRAIFLTSPNTVMTVITESKRRERDYEIVKTLEELEARYSLSSQHDNRRSIFKSSKVSSMLSDPTY